MTLLNNTRTPAPVRLSIFPILLLLLHVTAAAQTNARLYHVVVGGFRSEANAKKLVVQLAGTNLNADYSFQPGRGLYYVFVAKTASREQCMQLLADVRSRKELADAWVFAQDAGFIADGSDPPQPLADEGRQAADNPDSTAQDHVPSAVVHEDGVKDEVATGQVVAEKVMKPFHFRLTNAVTGEVVPGDVLLAESERDTSINFYAANQVVLVPPPVNSSGSWLVVCKLAGYRPFRKAISYENPVRSVPGATTGADAAVMLPIRLTPAKRYEYFELEGVSFFDNSAVLKRQSERSLLQLVSLMKDPDYKIRIHGHTHADGEVEFTVPGGDDPFDLSAAGKVSGSMKELSEYRARSVKLYLVAKGISGRRVSTRGEGGRLKIYSGAANDRIEIKVVRD